MKLSSVQCNYFIYCLSSNTNKLSKSDLIFALNYMISTLRSIDFDFNYILLLGYDIDTLSSLPIKKVRFLFNYCRTHYLYLFLGFLIK